MSSSGSAVIKGKSNSQDTSLLLVQEHNWPTMSNGTLQNGDGRCLCDVESDAVHSNA